MKSSLLIAALLLASPFARAGGDAAAEPKSKVCAACHGADFDTPVSPDIPRLAGQRKDYLAHALADYKSGSRKNAVMNDQAAALSTQDIAELSAHISGLSGKLKVIPLERFVR